MLAAEALALAEPEKGDDIRRTVNDAVKVVAADLGNTAAVARSSYIHPALIEGYEEEKLPVAELREALDEGGGRLTEEIVIDFLDDAAS